jgi:hypothetical protein
MPIREDFDDDSDSGLENDVLDTVGAVPLVSFAKKKKNAMAITVVPAVKAKKNAIKRPRGTRGGKKNKKPRTSS